MLQLPYSKCLYILGLITIICNLHICEGRTTKSPQKKQKVPGVTPQLILETLFLEKFGFPLLPQNVSGKVAPQFYVTQVEGISGLQNEHGSLVDYMDTDLMNEGDNFTIPVIFVVIQNVSATNCSAISHFVVHQRGKNSRGEEQSQTFVSSSFLGNASDGHQSEGLFMRQTHFGNNNNGSQISQSQSQNSKSQFGQSQSQFGFGQQSQSGFQGFNNASQKAQSKFGQSQNSSSQFGHFGFTMKPFAQNGSVEKKGAQQPQSVRPEPKSYALKPTIDDDDLVFVTPSIN